MRKSFVRILRLSVGGVVLGAGLSVVVFEHLAGASASAVINARMTTLQAPTAGRLSLYGHHLGARVARGEPLASVTNERIDTTRRDDLLLERETLAARQTRLREEISGIDAALATLRTRIGQYGRERVRQLEAALTENSARLAAARARLEHARAERGRAEALHARGHATRAFLDEREAAARVAERAVEELAAARTAAETELAAAREGVFLGDGPNDAPVSEQEARRLTLRRTGLGAELAEADSRIAALEERIAAERRHVAKRRHALLKANVDGRVWEILAEDGEHVHATQDVVRLLDCDSVLVTASVTESVYNGLRPGDAASFRINGTGEVFAATVARLAGEGAASVYRNLAVAPTDEHLKRFDVTLDVPALAAHGELGCAVGRTGRVFFESRPLDWARRVVAEARP